MSEKQLKIFQGNVGGKCDFDFLEQPKYDTFFIKLVILLINSLIITVGADFVAKTIGSHHRPGMQHDAMTDNTAISDVNPGMENTAGTNPHIPTDIAPRSHLGFIAHLGTFLQNRMGPDAHVPPQADSRGHHRRRMHARKPRCRRRGQKASRPG